MKRHISTALVWALPFCLHGQAVIDPEWVKSRTSAVGGAAEAWGVDTGSDGEVYWAVSMDSTGLGLDVACMRYGPDGTAQWAAPLFFGGPGTQHAYTVHVNDSALFVGGRVCPLTGFSCDMLLLRADPSDGSLIWQRTQDFGNSGYDEVDGMAADQDGIWCTGWAQALQTGPYQTEIGLWKLNYDGETEWTNHFGQSETAEHQDGHMVLGDDAIYCAGLWNGHGVANIYNGSAFIGRFSRTEGSFIDSALFGYPSSMPFDVENALGLTTDGTDLYVTGYTTPAAADNWQILIAKFNPDMGLIWMETWGGSGNETARGITVADGKVYVAGVTMSPELSTGGAADAVLLVYGTDGSLLGHATWGDTLDNGFRDMAVHGTSAYLTGTSGHQLFSGGGGQSAFLLKVGLDSVLTSGGAGVLRPLSVQAWPNPAQDHVYLRVAGSMGHVSVTLLNLFGRELLRKSMSMADRTLRFDLTDLPAGMYIIRTADMEVTSTVRLLVRR